jgi:hypothetical protein
MLPSTDVITVVPSDPPVPWRGLVELVDSVQVAVRVYRQPTEPCREPIVVREDLLGAQACHLIGATVEFLPETQQVLMLATHCEVVGAFVCVCDHHVFMDVL